MLSHSQNGTNVYDNLQDTKNGRTRHNTSIQANDRPTKIEKKLLPSGEVKCK